jgi:hypothetical protein
MLATDLRAKHGGRSARGAPERDLRCSSVSAGPDRPVLTGDVRAAHRLRDQQRRAEGVPLGALQLVIEQAAGDLSQGFVTIDGTGELVIDGRSIRGAVRAAQGEGGGRVFESARHVRRAMVAQLRVRLREAWSPGASASTKPPRPIAKPSRATLQRWALGRIRRGNGRVALRPETRRAVARRRRR